MVVIKKGSKVKVEYTGIVDGTVFDSSEKHGRPLEFTVGNGQVIAGLDKAMVGMVNGQSKEVVIAPENAYGPYNEELIQEIPRQVLPENQEAKAGMTIMISLPKGEKLPARIVSVGEKIKIDLNHPLAGKELHFKIKVVDVI